MLVAGSMVGVPVMPIVGVRSVAGPALGAARGVQPVDVAGFGGDEQRALRHERLRVHLADHVGAEQLPEGATTDERR
ncbi:MAG: hypothetical protein USCGTAYLOR_01933 [Chromatiales bacterium USCg_Taylor]|nr:MAG: hypothetical protein USCGTAYLOR_01933 [Chromatiales bacterium USCg_Taylor]